MKCSKARDLMTAMRPGDRSSAVSEHLEACTECEQFAMRLLAVRDSLGSHPGLEPTPAFAPGVLAALPPSQPAIGLAAIKVLPVGLALAAVLSGWVALFAPSPIDLLEGETRLAAQTESLPETRDIGGNRGGGSEVENTLVGTGDETDLLEWVLGIEDES